MKNTTAMADYELRHIEALRKDLAGCTVLLKKDGSFPLEKPCTLAAYGSGVRRTIRGGTGSGEVNSRYIVTIEEGLQQAGFTLTGMEWHTGYEQAREKAHKAFLKQLKKDAKAAKQNFILYGMGKVMPEPEYDLPLNAEGDAAIYVVSRISGEGNDRTPLKGDIRLTDSEVRDILALDKKFTRFMLVLNVGGVVDLSPVMGVRNILLLSQLGVETGGALADILLGKANPSGKLTTTWAAFEEYPEMPDFEDMNETRYREGIYVGYRYFDTFGIKPAFCFGYGLSYTEFSLKTESVHVEKDEIYAAVRVQNIGSYAGKEVVQLYYSAPEGGLEKPYQELAAYGKTKELLPGEEELLKLSLNVRDMASYSEEKAAWLLEPGEYLLRVGNSSENTQVAARLLLKEEVLTE
uniref:glycoside hydrolase family 3 C-terminal domain-containing protein n=1 Tax=Gemmiger formicilis TaxID=745368 RepID=UPI0040295AA1